ncbi:hypothetical protein IMX26_00790 [Clostridium sp. 'deep sea']|uniref:hypothetical protein n=1 Tax=Clostridium sp. 'deep sea' TaxID=2779445 RepID=UPI0018967487|nr:hypothetical protein [Clostridium sp. 'deep sea']QOR35412.1 hypothetical protein IMX26_00790 [Clostridium sp. 'deep sea']
MNLINLIDIIKQKDFNKQYFVNLVITNGVARDIVIDNLLNNEHIMVYYHCYYVVDLASLQSPELFYCYFNNFAKLLYHKNSYHRDIALTILANLAKVDQEKKLDSIFNEYLLLIYDKKFNTGKSCIKNLAKIFNYKSNLVMAVIPQLLYIHLQSDYSNKQLELLKYDILVLLEMAYHNYPNQQELLNYIYQCANSISPKTKKKAKQILQQLI